MAEVDDWVSPQEPARPNGLINTPDSPVDIAALQKKYPGLSAHLKNAVAEWGKGPGVMEFYNPWDSENPNRGKITLQFRDRSVPKEQLPDFAAADMLHFLGATTPDGKQVDPAYLALRQEMLSARTPGQIKADQQNYQDEKKSFGDSGSFEDYMANNRADAYMRGAAFPEINPEWKGFLTPAQAAIGAKVKAYLTGQKQ